jgi:hypothetical protein
MTKIFDVGLKRNGAKPDYKSQEHKKTVWKPAGVEGH